MSSTPNTNKALMRERNFLLLFLGTVLSTLGDSAYFILLGWFVVDITGSEGALGTALLCSSLPRLIFMLFGGVAADRIDRKTILVCSVAARAVVLAVFSMFLLRGTGPSDMYYIYGMAVIFGTVDAFFWPARGSIMPQVVGKESLSAANSLINTSMQLSMVIGPLLAAGLLYMSHYWLMFMTMAVFFLLSFFTLSGIKTRQPETDEAAAPVVKKSVLGEVREGIRYVLQIRVITLIMILSLFFNVVVMGPLNIGLPVLVKHLNWTGSTFGYLQGALGIGAIFGGVLTGVARGFRGRFHILALFVVVLGVSFGAMGAMTHFPYGLTMMFITGAMLSMINIPINTYIQTIVETEILGRVTALLTFMSIGLNPVSYAVSSFILQRGIISSGTLFMVGGAGMVILGLITASIREFRHAEEHPAWQAVYGKGSASTTSEAPVSS